MQYSFIGTTFNYTGFPPEDHGHFSPIKYAVRKVPYGSGFEVFFWASFKCKFAFTWLFKYIGKYIQREPYAGGGCHLDSITSQNT